MIMPRRLAGTALAAFTALALAVGLAGGCARAKSVLRPGVAPETSVFVQFDPLQGNHDINHLVHLYWSGTDPDGDVVAFDWRFVYPGEIPDTVLWHHTVNSDSTFAVYTPTGYSTPTFEVRAIDNSGLVDLSPASQVFAFTNQAPTLTLTPRRLTDTTFASVTLRWSAFDPDGDNGKMRFRVWLNGAANAANPLITDKQVFTIPTGAFLEGGHLLSGARTAFVQPIDDGGQLGALQSTRWYVRSPVPGGDHGRLLLIEDLGRNGSPFEYDSLYTNTASRNLGPNEYSILRLYTTQPFLSPEDMEQTFKLFDAVIWYRGPQAGAGGVSSVIQSNQDAIARYVDGGGRFMLESPEAIDGHGAPGTLSTDFLVKYLACDSLHFAPKPGESDSTAGMTINGGKYLQASAFQEIPGDTVLTMRSTIIQDGLRGFAVRDTHDVLLWARKGNLSYKNAIDIPIGISVPRDRAQPRSGRVVVVTYPLRAAWSVQWPGVPRVLAKIFKQMGLAN